MKLINIQKDSSDSLAGNDALAGQIFRPTGLCTNTRVQGPTGALRLD